MTARAGDGEHPCTAEENRRIWDANARWWDDRIGDGNPFQDLLIEPATERLLEITPGDHILDVGCGAGRFARRMAELGAHVVAIDHSAGFIERALERTPGDAAIEYHVLDAAEPDALVSLGVSPFDKAVCTMVLMDMPEILPLFSALPRLLKPGGRFVFSVTHPCFNTVGAQHFAESFAKEDGRQGARTGVKVSSYLTPSARKTEGIIGQPEAQYSYHRPLHLLLGSLFEVGFSMDGIEEPGLPPNDGTSASVRWDDTPDIPPVLVVRVRLSGHDGEAIVAEHVR